MKKQLSESGRRKKGCSYKKGSSHDMYPAKYRSMK